MDRDRSPSAEPPWEALEALAAGELPAAEAKALREQLAVEPGWQAAWNEIESVETLLRAEPLLALPLALVQDTLARVLPLERVRPWRVLARVAAAILVFCTSWFAFSGEAPAMADVGPRPEMALVDVPSLAPAVPAVLASNGDAGVNLALAAGGLLLVGAGVFLALRWHGAAGQGGAA